MGWRLFIVLLWVSSWSLWSQKETADSLYAIGDYQQAISIYEALDPPSATSYYKIGTAYESLGNLSKAVGAFKEALALDEEMLIAAMRYGQLLRRTHQLEKADSIFTILARRHPDNPGFHYQLGLVKEQQKDSSGIAHFQKTLQLNPAHQHALYRAAVYNYRNRKWDNVEALGKQALKLYPDNINMLRLLAKNANQLKDYHTAVERYKEIIDRLTPETKDYKELGFVYYHIYDYKRAIAAFEKVIERDGEDADILYNLGLLHHREGHYEEAKALFQTTISMKKFGLDKQYQSLALVYKSMENHQQAIQYFKMALAENPLSVRSQYEMAVSADNYYEDLNVVRGYYQQVIDKFKKSDNTDRYVELSEYRIKELTRKLFMDKD